MYLDIDDLKMQLLNLVVDRCYQRGRFLLTSGRESDFYIDSKNATLHPQGAKLLGSLVCASMNLSQFDAVAGPTLGADPMLTAISLAAYERGVTLPAMILRKEPKKHGTSQWIEGRKNVCAGARVLLVEDVITTGGSSLKALRILRDEEFVVRQAITLIDRQEGGREALESQGVQLTALVTFDDIKRQLGSGSQSQFNPTPNSKRSSK